MVEGGCGAKERQTLADIGGDAKEGREQPRAARLK